MSIDSQMLGKRGEDAACKYLVKKGYKIIERNYRVRNGEIDIIAIDKKSEPESLVFIEVKTRSNNNFGIPFESINYFKIKSIIRTSLIYASAHNNLPKRLRIDAISVIIDADSNISSLEHIENIC